MTEEYTLIEAESGLEPRTAGEKDIAYYAPTTLEEAENLKERNKGYHYLGGGTILNWKGSPRVKGLIDLKNLELGKIEVTPAKIVIGATATIQELAENKDLPEPLTTAAKFFTSRNVRNMATVGGTATGKFFVSDVLPVLLAFNADIEYFRDGKKAIIRLSQWLLEEPGLICSIIINHANRTVKLKQEKISKMDFPLIVTSVGFAMANNAIKDPVVAVSGASPKIVLSESAAEYLSGKQLSDVDFEALNTAAQKDVEPTGSVKATPRVKRRIIESHVKEITAELI